MGNDILVVAEHLGGTLSDTTFELLGMAKKLASQTGGSTVAALIGGDDTMLSQLGAADLVVRVGGGEIADFNPEVHGAALEAVVAAKQPRIVLIGYTSMGMDLASHLAVKADLAAASFAIGIEAGDSVVVTSQLYGGKMNVTTDLGSGPCVVSVLAGSAPADDGRAHGPPASEDLAVPPTAGKIRFRRLIEPEAGDVDITAQDMLVAIGRGIGNKDDVEVAEALAEALGAAVAGSRPLIDAGWLPKTRQVGKSGLKVSPKLYLALGISGAPEHIEGMKSSSTIIAVNTDKHAPIFNFAHYGMVADLFDVCEELTEIVEEKKG
ncbi:MAG: electron transfer flavoprotein subunit alpha/FixB family protein [Acidobacteriota bacterium]|nr:electron transfer flavoprotein subunit alpha/FixB family protein [Acidobacteriota bacterium]